MELSQIALAYVADERLKMNQFRAGLNPGLKEKMAVRHYTLYEDMYDITVNVEKATKEKKEFYNEQRGMKSSGDHCRNRDDKQPHKRPRKIFSNHPYADNLQRSSTCPVVVCNACRKPEHYACECCTIKWCFHCGSHLHQVKDFLLPPPVNK